MALQKLIVIWADGTFEGDNYQPMKDDFNEKIVGASASSDPINNSICRETQEDLVTNDAPVITVRTQNEAIQQIKNNPQAKIFFISSGSLGERIVPTIVKEYPHVHSFYIYCFKMTNHIHWALEYRSCLEMFDHQIDLLVRLMRDISNYFIEQGKIYLSLDDPYNALKYFKHSWNLETRANARDKMKPNTKTQEKLSEQPDYRDRLNLLEGDNGLIRQAEQALAQQPERQENA